EALFWLSFFPDEIGAGPGLKFDLFPLKHVLMPWTVVAIAMGAGGSYGDTQGKAVPRIAIKREHPDEISTKLSISCFVGHYPRVHPFYLGSSTWDTAWISVGSSP
ncbi:hypothetical protein, partial [Methanoculleus sp. UBA303]|uniref:hypothetical protein n=1 Tax=Methanoculleus sp. UBA303 TaxID=1915497 RepID=UPI0025EDF037